MFVVFSKALSRGVAYWPTRSSGVRVGRRSAAVWFVLHSGFLHLFLAPSLFCGEFCGRRLHSSASLSGDSSVAFSVLISGWHPSTKKKTNKNKLKKKKTKEKKKEMKGTLRATVIVIRFLDCSTFPS